jgi:ribulose-5-phosphate 4-epimerase/fuculose-1-phosphate aldolase
MDNSNQTLRRKVALGTRILAMQDCLGDILGHLSARIPGTDSMFMRCLGGNERGLLYSDVAQVRTLNFDRSASEVEGYRVPIELPIHGEIYKAKPDVQAVVHAHPYHCLLASIAGVALRPIYGAYEPLSLSAAIRGIPVYPRSVLIDGPELAAELIATMGDRDCCLMRGHGITVTGPSVEAVTLLALRLDLLAKITLAATRTGGQVRELPREDLDAFAFVVEQGLQGAVSKAYEWAWNHYAQRIADTVGLPAEE